MLKQSRGPLALAILIIAVGIGWLLTAQGIVPGIDWVWTLGLGVVGVLSFVLSGGLDKVSVILGPLLLASSILSILRQTGKLKIDVEVPILVILLGVLLLFAQMNSIPLPRWYLPTSEDSGRWGPK